MAKKRRANGDAANKRKRAEKILKTKPQLGRKQSPAKVTGSRQDDSGMGGGFDSSEQLCEARPVSEEQSGTSGLRVPEDGLERIEPASAQEVLWAWRSLTDDEREELAKSFTHEERDRILQDIVKANESEYERLLFGGQLKSSFSRVNRWLREHEGLGADMTNEQKEKLIQALQYFRDKYNSTFVYVRKRKPIHCTLTIGTQSGSDYPKRFRVQAKGRNQTVLAQRNKLPLLQLEKV